MRFLLAAAILVLAGCSSGPARRGDEGPVRGDITELNLITSPVGINLDDRPGPDGFTVKVYGSVEGRAKAVPIRGGTLEILMFDGTFFGRTNVPPALRIWSFSGEELSTHEFVAGVGTGYQFILAWGTNRPTQTLISVAARYTSAHGKIITSRPSSVAVVGR